MKRSHLSVNHGIERNVYNNSVLAKKPSQAFNFHFPALAETEFDLMTDEPCVSEKMNDLCELPKLKSFTTTGLGNNVQTYFNFKKKMANLKANKRDEQTLKKVENGEQNNGDSLVQSLNLNQKLAGSTTSTDRTTGPTFLIRHREHLFRLFTGSVENLQNWFKLRHNLEILFELVAVVENVKRGQWKSEKILVVRDSNSGPRLQVFYYEIDRALIDVSVGEIVVCVGRLVSRNRFQAFKIELGSEEDKINSQRLSCICGRVAEEVARETNKKKQQKLL